MASLSAGAIYININADTAAFEKGMQTARRELGKVDDSIGKTEKASKEGFFSIGNIASVALGNVAANAVMGLGSKIVDLGKNALFAGDNFNMAMLKYETLLGSKELATERVKELEKFAAKTPFEMGDVMKADTLLQGFGIRSEKLLTTIGDAAAISGSGFSDLSLVLGQLSQSKDLENIKQLVERGIVSFDELRGAGIKFAKDGSVVNSVEETYGAIVGIMEKKFGGGMEKLSGTLSGQLSTLMDTFNLFLGGLVRDSGILDLVTKGVAGLSPVIAELGNLSSIIFKGDFKGLFGLQEDDPIIDMLFTMRENFIAFMASLQAGAPGAFQQTYEMLKPLLDALMQLGQAILPIIPPVIDQLVATAQFAFPYIQELMQHWIDIITPIIQRITNEVIPLIFPVLERLFELFRILIPIVQPILIHFYNIMANTMNMVIGVISGVLQFAIGFLDVLIGIFTGNGDRVKAGFVGMFDGLATAVEAIFKGVINGIITNLNFGFENVNKLIDNIPENIRPSKLPTIPKLNQGGPVRSGMPYLVGDNPDGSINSTTELFVPRTGGKVYSSSELQDMLSGGNSGGGNVYFEFKSTLADRSSLSDFFKMAKGIAKKEGFNVT